MLVVNTFFILLLFLYVCWNHDFVQAQGKYKEVHYEETEMTWKDAYEFCVNWGGRMVTIKSKEENDMLKAFRGTSNKEHRIWIGGGKMKDILGWNHDEIRWIDNTPITFDNWAEEEPKDAHKFFCMTRAPEEWYIYDCVTDFYPTICEKFQICPKGSYCPAESALAIICPKGSYCPTEGLEDPINCDPGYYCPNEGMESQLVCDAGYYCPTSGIINQIPCPYGNYCPGSLTLPIPIKENESAIRDRGTATKVPCTSAVCYRYIISRNTIEVSTFEEAISLNDNTNTIMVTGLKFGTKINQQVGKSVSGGKQMYVECEKNQFHTPIFIQNPLILEETTTGIFNKIVFKNCLVVGSIELKSGTSIILDNSSLSGPVSVSSIDANPSYIVVMDNSHVASENLLPYLAQRRKNLNIVKYQAVNSVFGCDTVPACNQTPFFNNKDEIQPSYESYYSKLTTMWYNTSEDLVPANAKAISKKSKLMSLQSFLTCGALGTKMHARSTYLGYALYCGMNSDAIENHYYFFSALHQYIGAINITVNDEDINLLNNVRQVAESRSYLYQTAERNSSDIILVPRVTADYLRQATCTFCISELIKKLKDISDKIERSAESSHEIITELRNAIDQTEIGKAIVNKLDLSTRTLVNNQVTFMKNVKENSKTSYEISKKSLEQQKQLLQVLIAKYDTIDSRADEIQYRLENLQSEMKKELNKVLAKEAVKAGVQAIAGLGQAVYGIVKVKTGQPDGFSTIMSGLENVAKGGYAGWKTYNNAAKTPAFETLDVSFAAYIGAIETATKAIESYERKETIDASAFRMPISEAEILKNEMISYTRSDAGCDGTYQTYRVLRNLCNRFIDEITALSLLLKEKNQGIEKELESRMRIKLLEFEVKQYDENIRQWTDGIQQVKDSIGDNCEFANEITNIKTSKEDQLRYTIQTIHMGNARAFTHATLVVNNAIDSIRTICRAIVYQNPFFLEGEDDDYNKLCGNTLSYVSLESAIQSLEDLKIFMEHTWLNSEPPKSLTDSTMDITSLLPKNFYENPSQGYTITITPESYLRLTTDFSLANKENIDLVFVSLYVTNGNEILYKPKTESGSYDNRVVLRAPFMRQYKTKDYLFDIEGPKESVYETQVKSSSTAGTLWSPSGLSISLEDAFAFETPFATMDIYIDSDFEIDDPDARFFLRFYVKGNGVRETKKPTPKPTEKPDRPTRDPTRRPTRRPTEPTRPPVEPTQPPVEPTRPPVEPTQPPAGPSEQPTIKTKKPTPPTVPTSSPTKKVVVCEEITNRKACRKRPACMFVDGLCIPK